MEGSIKERLTGALIFVAVVVVIVPEMFSGPAPRPAAAAPAQSSEAGPPLRTYSMTLNDSGETRASAPAAAVSTAPLVESSAAQRPSSAPAAVEPPSATVVTSSPAAPEPVTSAVGSWWLQVGIFSSRSNAERLVQKLQATGFAVDMDRYLTGGKEMFRVRAGPVRDRGEALALQGRLAASGNNSVLLPP